MTAGWGGIGVGDGEQLERGLPVGDVAHAETSSAKNKKIRTLFQKNETTQPNKATFKNILTWYRV
jgi:hypothetical protein